MKNKLFYIPIAIVLLLVACNLPTIKSSTPTSDLPGTIVAQTLQAISSPQASPPSSPVAETPTLPVVTPTSNVAEVKGMVCYPHAEPRPITLYFQETRTGILSQVSITDNRKEYTVTLQPGRYIAYAWTPDFTDSGSHSACGANADCKDATPLAFDMLAGQIYTGIDICDWTHGPYDVPYPPGFQPEATLGTIEGEISGYPYGSLPEMAVIFFSQSTKYWYWIGTTAGQIYFSINDLPPGDYQVVAYDGSGHAGGVPNIVKVTAGQSTYVILKDWVGTYPSDPR